MLHAAGLRHVPRPVARPCYVMPGCHKDSRDATAVPLCQNGFVCVSGRNRIPDSRPLSLLWRMAVIIAAEGCPLRCNMQRFAS